MGGRFAPVGMTMLLCPQELEMLDPATELSRWSDPRSYKHYDDNHKSEYSRDRKVRPRGSAGFVERRSDKTKYRKFCSWGTTVGDPQFVKPEERIGVFDTTEPCDASTHFIFSSPSREFAYDAGDDGQAGGRAD